MPDNLARCALAGARYELLQDLAGVVRKGYSPRLATGFFSITEFSQEAGSPSKGFETATNRG